jgi:hypothetical protein
MNHRLFDTVVLERDIPAHRLCKGDVGAVIQVHESDSVDVEFVLPNGRAQAQLTLRADDVRPIADNEMLTVRRLSQSA